MSVRKDLDELINWYERHGKKARQIVVCATPNTVRRFAKRERDGRGRAVRNGKLMYRGREIVPTRKPRKEQAKQSTQTEAIYESRGAENGT